MFYIILGCLAFVLVLIFDINKVFLIHKWINIFFAIGVILLTISTMAICVGSINHYSGVHITSWIWVLLSFISLILLIYTLFFEIPFKKTYIESYQENSVVDTGMYALCRHPGVIWFFFFYLFLWLAIDKTVLLWALVIWTLFNIIYVYVQDRWLFPKIFTGYEHYKCKVPFLIPNSISLKNYVKSMFI